LDADSWSGISLGLARVGAWLDFRPSCFSLRFVRNLRSPDSTRAENERSLSQASGAHS
jgi:hypothetical protein